jgi:hypothetical protein
MESGQIRTMKENKDSDIDVVKEKKELYIYQTSSSEVREEEEKR